MLSRSTGPLRRTLPAVAACLAALLTGCGVGQVTQTDSLEPAVNGNRGDVGDIALRDVAIAYPENEEYRAGDDAPLVLTIVNTGATDDELLDVSSPAAADVRLSGDARLPAGIALQVIVPGDGGAGARPTTETSVPEESITEPSPPAETGEESAAPPPQSDEPPTLSDAPDSESTESPTAPPAGAEQAGTMSIVLTGLVQDLAAGRNVPVTFVFANAGQITIDLPIATPETARRDPPRTEEESGH